MKQREQQRDQRTKEFRLKLQSKGYTHSELDALLEEYYPHKCEEGLQTVAKRERVDQEGEGNKEEQSERQRREEEEEKVLKREEDEAEEIKTELDFGHGGSSPV